jgi:hypothetical protein
MPRRRLIGEAGALLAWLVAAGCGSSSTPAAKPAAGFSSPASPALAGPAIEGVASPKPIQAEAPTVPSRAPVLTISPEAATITADDPGVQLLLRWQSADGTVRDLTGEQPTPEQIRRFLADKDPEKRLSLVDRLPARPEFVLFWRIKLGDLLQISQGRQGNGAYRYQEWIDRCLNENTPWDVMVTKMLTALGDPNDPETGGPVNYASDTLEANVQAEPTAQRFLGLRRCAAHSATTILSMSGPRMTTSDRRPSSPRSSGGGWVPGR